MTIPESIEQMCAQRLTGRAASIAAKLRSLADRVEQEAGRAARVYTPGIPNYASIAANVQHEVMSALPNLQLSELTRDAQEADAARAAERAAEY